MLINVSRSLETAAVRSSTTRGQKANVEIQSSWMSCVTTGELTHMTHMTCHTIWVHMFCRFLNSFLLGPLQALQRHTVTRRDTSWHVTRRAQSAAYVWKKEWNWVTWKTAIDSYSNYMQLLYCTPLLFLKHVRNMPRCKVLGSLVLHGVALILKQLPTFFTSLHRNPDIS